VGWDLFKKVGFDVKGWKELDEKTISKESIGKI
jgi:hypothetical protein